MSFIAPILPDNSPCSPWQRAWLDGYLAALFADEATPRPNTIAPRGEPQSQPQPQPTQAEAEDFPWHDPALPLDDRLALAAARPIEHRLMAAMGQLDCGQCGYLCRSYAEAIAGGEEAQLTRCVPGGKATSRALKELLAGIGDPAPVPAPAAAVSSGTASAPGGFGELLPARLVQAARLTRPGSDKDTRHVVLADQTGALSY